MAKLSVVISVLNGAAVIEDCLKSVEWADEIIVVDHESTDGTLKIVKKYTNDIFSQPNDITKIDIQKNFGFKKAKHEWILSIDADERIDDELQKEIKEVIEHMYQDAYAIPRKNIIFGKWIKHSIWWPDYQIRLFRKGRAEYVDAVVHKDIQVKGTVGKLTNPLTHENYQTVSQYLQKMDVYTESEALSFIKNNTHFSWIEAVRMPIGDFLKTFFFQRGYKDGFHGLVLSVLQGFYMFLVVIKVWEKQGFREENDKHFLKNLLREWERYQKEVSYWFMVSFIQSSGNFIEKIPYRLKRKYLDQKLKKEF
ncbi:MAG: glycosyltransferase family 2 protein [Candidatus Levybacteria bacterium]|nr:glycosyltransferase family 2 protein [Candidatus Levybacteria bacterium]